MLLVPVGVILLAGAGIGASWLLSLLALATRDVTHVLGLVLMMLTFLSPFAFTPEMIPQALQLLVYINPLSYFVLFFQYIISFGSLPPWGIVLACFVLSGTLFTLGYRTFRKVRSAFFDFI